MVAKKMVDLFQDMGGHIILASEVKAIIENSKNVTIKLDRDKITSSYLLACAGLQADRIAKMIGIDTRNNFV